MRNLGQYEGAMTIGHEMSPHVGAVVPAYQALLDGPGGDQLLCPTRREHWPHVLPGLPMPTQWLPMDESGGNVTDHGLAAVSYTTTGATYQQPISGSNLPWVTFAQVTGNGARADALTGAAPDPGQPIFMVLDFRASATGGDRTLFTIGQSSTVPNALVQLKSAGVLQTLVTGSTNVVGAVDYRSAANRHRIVVYWEPGDTAGGGPILRIWTRHETIAVTAGSGPGGVLSASGAGAFGIGGTGTTPPALTCRGFAIWAGRVARTAANLGGARQGGRTLLVASRATVLY